MEQYIPKAAVLAELERRIKERDIQMKSGCWVSSTFMYEDLLDFLDTLEVKDIELEQETQRILDEHFFYPEEDDELKEIPKLARYIAKHFFELGMQQSKNDNNNEEKK